MVGESVSEAVPLTPRSAVVSVMRNSRRCKKKKEESDDFRPHKNGGNREEEEKIVSMPLHVILRPTAMEGLDPPMKQGDEEVRGQPDKKG